MKTRALPDQSVLHELLRYEPSTGKLYWKPRESKYFSREQDMLMWNKRFGNTEAFTSTNKDGYRRGNLLSKTALAHRVLFKMLHGTAPAPIDHDDQDPGNNRQDNLKASNAISNSKNMKLFSSNTSGHTGVKWDSARKLWVAEIKANGQYIFLGRFADKHEAVRVRENAEKQYSFNANHGK